jgi:hypothetical protein
MKSIPFMIVRKVPVDINEGEIIDFEETGKHKITKIKSVRFLDMRTMQIVGLCRAEGVN